MKKQFILIFFVALLSAKQMPEKQAKAIQNPPKDEQKACSLNEKTYLSKEKQKMDRLGNGPFYLKSMFPLCPLTIGLNLSDNSMYFQGIEFGTCGSICELKYYCLYRDYFYNNCVFTGWSTSISILGAGNENEIGLSFSYSWSIKMYKNWFADVNLGFTVINNKFFPFPCPIPGTPSVIGIKILL